MKKACSFCGRSDREVKLLITGISGYICEDCAQQAYQIVLEQQAQRNGHQKSAKSQTKIPKPREIKEYLE